MGIRELLAAALDDRRDAKRTNLTAEDVEVACNKLTESICQVGYKPNLVIGILEGGRVPANALSRNLEVPIGWLRIGREIRIDHVYKDDLEPIRWAYSVYHHYLFRTRSPRILTTDLPSLVGRSILLVDDAMDTGRSIEVAKSFLDLEGVDDVKIACLSTTRPARHVDFTALPPGDYRFPWSVG